jgi:hypothetical protein
LIYSKEQQELSTELSICQLESEALLDAERAHCDLRFVCLLSLTIT